VITQLNIYVPSEMLRIADERPTHFLANVRAAFCGAGFQVSFVDATKAALFGSYSVDAYCLFYRNRPTHAHALEIRPAPFGPFWMIDKTADPAQKVLFKITFDPTGVDPLVADAFFARMVERQIKTEAHAGGYVFVALQGVIDRQRFWQSMTPVEMVAATVKHEKQRKILMKLHPRESYSSDDLSKLNALIDGDRVQIVDGDLDASLAGCDYTVSMNSAVSFKGLLYRKPGILFGDTDFHHAFQQVRSKSVSACFADVMNDTVEYEKYMFWYLRRQHLWNFKPSIQDDILGKCRNLGWEF